MKKSRKALSILLCLAMVFSLLTACGSESADNGGADAEAPAASADASGDMAMGGGAGGPGGGGGSGSAGQEFATFEEVSSLAGVIIDGSEVNFNDSFSGTIEGDITADGMKGVKIDVAEGNGIAITKSAETDTFTIEDCEIHVTAGQINQDAGYEAVGGVGIGVETGELWIKNSTIKSEDARSTPVYLFSTSQPEGTSLVVVDSNLEANSSEIWMPPFKLLSGGARATLLMTRNNSWFYGANVLANNWGAISQDSVDAYSYVINSTGTVTEGGYASYLTYGLRSYGSKFYAGQYGLFMCGTTDILTDSGAAALEDADAMSKVHDYAVDEAAITEIVAPYNALVVHNSLPDNTMTTVGVFKNTLLSTMREDLPDAVTVMEPDCDFFMPGVDILGSGNGCGASYFFSKNLFGSIALVRSMNADFTFDNCDLRTSNGVLVQSVITYDPPSASGYLDVGEGENVNGVIATFLNGDYEGDILAQDYQRKMTINIGEGAVLTGKIVSGTWRAWQELWTEDALTAVLESDGYTADVFNNPDWVSDVQANLIQDDADYETTENLGADVNVKKGGTLVINGTSSISKLVVEDGATVKTNGKIYVNCDASNGLSFYDYSKGEEVKELTAGTYENVVIVF